MSKAYEQALDNEMQQQETFVRFGDVENGNYTKFNEDGTQEIFVNGVSQGVVLDNFDNKYFSNRFNGQSLLNTLKFGRNVRMGVIGDSTSQLTDNFIEQLAKLLGTLGETESFKLVYYKYNPTSQEWYTNLVRGSSATASELNGIKFTGGTNGYLTHPDDTAWTATDGLKIEWRVSDYDISNTNQTFIQAKWLSTSLVRSYNVAFDDDDVRLAWMDSSLANQSETFTGALAGVSTSDIVHMRVELEFDRGDGNYEVRLYRTTDLGFNWTLVDTIVGTGTTSINKATGTIINVNNLNNDPSGSFTQPIKIHKSIFYNGLSGEIITLPTNIEEFTVVDSSNSVSDGDIATLEIYNGAVGGKDYAYYDSAKIKETTVPDSNQYFIVNHGHNSSMTTYNDFNTEIDDFVTRLEAIITNPTIMFSTQNPKISGPTYPWEKQAQDIRSRITGQYAMRNSHCLVDSSTAIQATVPGWEAMMDDQTHPDASLYAIMAGWWFNYMTGQ